MGLEYKEKKNYCLIVYINYTTGSAKPVDFVKLMLNFC